MLEHVANKDLVWTIGTKVYLESAVGFLKRFESALCLFSSSVRQLYTNYEIVRVSNSSNRMVALPNPYAFHDTFNNVLGDAVVPTGMRIVPSEFNGSGEEDLLLVYKSKRYGTTKAVPLRQGLKALEKHYGKGNFLPVMINKDLQFINNKTPAMHLHRVDINKLNHLSDFQRSDLRLAIEDKMATLVA